MKNLSVIITAGGIGKRMGGIYPKQFRLLNGLPVLMRTIEVFHHFDSAAQIIITLPNDWKSEWGNLCNKYNFTIPHEIVDGGLERFHSVKNALVKCSGEQIMIHDGVRPLVSQETLNQGSESLQTHLGAIPVVDSVDSLRWSDGATNKALNRTEYKRVQTPQCFRKQEILKAYELEFTTKFTDDASVFEAAGFAVHLFPGNEENIKITTENDLVLTEFWWTNLKSNN